MSVPSSQLISLPKIVHARGNLTPQLRDDSVQHVASCLIRAIASHG